MELKYILEISGIISFSEKIEIIGEVNVEFNKDKKLCI